MQRTIKAKAYVLGDNIDTDQIIPAHHLVYNLDDPKERLLYGKYALSGVPESGAGLPDGLPGARGRRAHLCPGRGGVVDLREDRESARRAPHW